MYEYLLLSVELKELAISIEIKKIQSLLLEYNRSGDIDINVWYKACNRLNCLLGEENIWN